MISRSHISQSQASAQNPGTQEVEINRFLGSWPACLGFKQKGHGLVVRTGGGRASED